MITEVFTGSGCELLLHRPRVELPSYPRGLVAGDEDVLSISTHHPSPHTRVQRLPMIVGELIKPNWYANSSRLFECVCMFATTTCMWRFV